MNRRLKYIICVVIILIGLVAFSKPIFNLFVNTDTIANKIGCRLFEFNTITVKSDSDINLNKIEIRTNNRVVYRDNTQQDKIGQFYGHVILEIYYDSLLVSEIGHWKRNNWYTNGYKVILRKHKNNIAGIIYHIDKNGNLFATVGRPTPGTPSKLSLLSPTMALAKAKFVG
mgnify:CR=1 FL=1